MDDIDIAQRRQAEQITYALAAIKRPAGESATHCAECDDPIPEARRKAVPGCRLCIACQRAAEK
jgi:phage/conjugal plasmid C-4 type zinc finger TraR family protein